MTTGRINQVTDRDRVVGESTTPRKESRTHPFDSAQLAKVCWPAGGHRHRNDFPIRKITSRTLSGVECRSRGHQSQILVPDNSQQYTILNRRLTVLLSGPQDCAEEACAGTVSLLLDWLTSNTTTLHIRQTSCWRPTHIGDSTLHWQKLSNSDYFIPGHYLIQYHALPGGPTPPDTLGDQRPVTPPPPGRRHPGRPGPGPHLRHRLYGWTENFPKCQEPLQKQTGRPQTKHSDTPPVPPRGPSPPRPTS